MGGHSRRCAELAVDAGRVLGPRRGHDHRPLRRAALVHDFGTTDRAELDLGQARAAHAHGVRPGRAPPDADRADAAPLAGARRPESGRLGAPREVRRLGVPQARARRCRRPRRVRARGDRDLRGADDRAGGPAAVLARRRGRRASHGSSRQGVLEPRASRAVLVAAGHGEPRAPSGKAAAASGRAHPSRGRRAATRGARAHDAPDRRPAVHLPQDGRPPHPAHLRQDRRRRRVPRAALWAMQHAVVG